MYICFLRKLVRKNNHYNYFLPCKQRHRGIKCIRVIILYDGIPGVQYNPIMWPTLCITPPPGLIHEKRSKKKI